jgi:hypothetical protein
MSNNYNHNSTDAVLSRITEKLDELGRKMDRIEVQTIKTNGRVSGIERWRDVVNARVGVIAAGISGLITFCAWIIQRYTWHEAGACNNSARSGIISLALYQIQRAQSIQQPARFTLACAGFGSRFI